MGDLATFAQLVNLGLLLALLGLLLFRKPAAPEDKLDFPVNWEMVLREMSATMENLFQRMEVELEALESLIRQSRQVLTGPRPALAVEEPAEEPRPLLPEDLSSRQRARELAGAGHTVEEIIQATGLRIGEVQLLVGLAGRKT